MLHQLGRNVEAEIEATRAIPVFTQLAGDFPQIPRYGEEQAAGRDISGQVLVALGRNKEAKLSLEPAVEAYGGLAKNYPDVPEYRQRLAVARQPLAQILHKLGDPKAAEEMFRSARQVFDDLAARIPKLSPTATSWHSSARASACCFRKRVGPTRPRPCCERPGSFGRNSSISTICRNTDTTWHGSWRIVRWPHCEDPRAATELAKRAKNQVPANPNYWCALGAAYYRAGQWQAGVEAIQEAIRLRGQTSARDWFLLAMSQQHLGHPGEARKSYDQARKAMEANTMGDSEVARLRKEAAGLLKLAD